MFLLVVSFVKTTSFKYSSFTSNSPKIYLQGNASIGDGVIDLTTNRIDKSRNFSIGRALYEDPVHLYDVTTGKVADFITHFKFNIIVPKDQSYHADGLAFFLIPNGSDIPPYTNLSGGYLGLFSETSKYNVSEHPVVAIEFDTYTNGWDPLGDHVGIDINSINSTVTYSTSVTQSIKNVWVRYNSSAKELSVYFADVEDAVMEGNLILSHDLNLRDVLPEWVSVGFSATTGTAYQLHQILSWEFNSTDFDFPSRVYEPSPSPTYSISPKNFTSSTGPKKANIKLLISLVVCGSFFVLGVSLILFVWRKKSKNGKKDEEDTISDISTDNDYEKGTGPKKFTYGEIVRATNNFDEEGKLGEGGFGSVYRGLLSVSDKTVDVAVKRVSKDSEQGKKEFVSEVRTISQLGHRNLVKLIGWCHEKREFLLIYEFMQNGSLDHHLFRGRTMLTWVLRCHIAHGLASALLYLHEEWEQCVVHRDIKSSNVMLDSKFNAKLGDFGLASFGVVALEIACGRRAVEPREETSKVGLVAWVWELYGSGRLLEAADSKLNMDFDEQQMERLMVVGLWCSNWDSNLRPSIRQVIKVLNFEAPLPELPSKMSVPTHFIPPNQDLGFSGRLLDSQGSQTQASCSSYSANSSSTGNSTKHSSSAALLHSEQANSSSTGNSTKHSSSAALLHSEPR
ncbi:L-type lectin-domain containing receptor kinase IX.1 [Thalictrum thalictroides]|uniref:L-type lectin-domain containing receptor kinase IX.1 n=1 Tax=Thalictrum thalictroides TaxID=46969 RepID=A0A7J6XCK8_THATH|nr:L-type lectin-domain containing receptor kinase IX.1 [Thalictrum thalictroides]